LPRLVLSLCLTALCACSTPPKPVAIQPLTETCNEIVRKMENGSGLTPPEKKEVIEKLAGLTFHWHLRVLNTSDETSHGEFVNGMAFTVECQDRPSVTTEGMRYLFTLYFDRRVPELTTLSKGAMLTVDGMLTSYEGQGAFAARVSAYAKE
jgi:hypothetical protein